MKMNILIYFAVTLWKISPLQIICKNKSHQHLGLCRKFPSFTLAWPSLVKASANELSYLKSFLKVVFPQRLGFIFKWLLCQTHPFFTVRHRWKILNPFYRECKYSSLVLKHFSWKTAEYLPADEATLFQPRMNTTCPANCFLKLFLSFLAPK